MLLSGIKIDSIPFQIRGGVGIAWENQETEVELCIVKYIVKCVLINLLKRLKNDQNGVLCIHEKIPRAATQNWKGHIFYNIHFLV